MLAAGVGACPAAHPRNRAGRSGLLLAAGVNGTSKMWVKGGCRCAPPDPAQRAAGGFTMCTAQRPAVVPALGLWRAPHGATSLISATQGPCGAKGKSHPSATARLTRTGTHVRRVQGRVQLRRPAARAVRHGRPRRDDYELRLRGRAGPRPNRSGRSLGARPSPRSWTPGEPVTRAETDARLRRVNTRRTAPGRDHATPRRCATSRAATSQ